MNKKGNIMKKSELIDAMKKMIRSAGVGNVDYVTKTCCNLLDSMGYVKEAKEVYDFYRHTWLP